MPESRYRSRSYKRINKKTPGGQSVLRYKKKKNQVSIYVLNVVQFYMEFQEEDHMKLENYQKLKKTA